MRYGLRTLLIVLALGPPVLAALWWVLSPLLAYPLVVNTFVVLGLSIGLGLAAMIVLLAVAGVASVIDHRS
jgi:hypothetical protein